MFKSDFQQFSRFDPAKVLSAWELVPDRSEADKRTGTRDHCDPIGS